MEKGCTLEVVVWEWVYYSESMATNNEKPEVTVGLVVAVCHTDFHQLRYYFTQKVTSVSPKQFVVDGNYRYRLEDWSAVGSAPDIEPFTKECEATNQRTALIREINAIKFVADVRHDASLEDLLAAHAALAKVLKPKATI